MKKRAIIVLAIMALAVAMVPSVDAACVPSKTFTSWDSTDYLFHYVYNFSGNLGTAVGSFWLPGDRDASNEGTQTIDVWLRYYTPTSQWFVSGEWGTTGTVGCAGGSMIIAMTDVKGDSTDFAVGQADETPVKDAHFNLGNMTFVPLPRPRITNRSRVVDTVTLDLQFDDVAAGFSSRFGHTAPDFITGITL